MKLLKAHLYVSDLEILHRLAQVYYLPKMEPIWNVLSIFKISKGHILLKMYIHFYLYSSKGIENWEWEAS